MWRGIWLVRVGYALISCFDAMIPPDHTYKHTCGCQSVGVAMNTHVGGCPQQADHAGGEERHKRTEEQLASVRPWRRPTSVLTLAGSPC